MSEIIPRIDRRWNDRVTIVGRAGSNPKRSSRSVGSVIPRFAGRGGVSAGVVLSNSGIARGGLVRVTAYNPDKERRGISCIIPFLLPNIVFFQFVCIAFLYSCLLYTAGREIQVLTRLGSTSQLNMEAVRPVFLHLFPLYHSEARMQILPVLQRRTAFHILFSFPFFRLDS